MSPPVVLQAKLEVGSVDDPLEKEADQVADRVLQAPDPSTAAGAPEEPPGSPPMAGGAQVQRRAAPGASAGMLEAPPIVQQALSGGGRPLDAGARAYFEPRFGFDLSEVRIHTGARAAESARAVNALAYTVGQDIVFGQGRYAPGEREGRKLLAHELAHVAQQSATARPAAIPAVSSARPRVARETGPGLSTDDLVVVAQTNFTKNGLQMAKDLNSGAIVATLKVGGLLKLGDKHPNGEGKVFFATVMKSKDEPYPDSPTGVVRVEWVRPAAESDIASAPAPVFPAAKPQAPAAPAPVAKATFKTGDLVVLRSEGFTKDGLQMAKEQGSQEIAANLKPGDLLKLGDVNPVGGGEVFYATVMIDREHEGTAKGVVRTDWIKPAPVPAKPAAPADAPPAQQDESPPKLLPLPESMDVTWGGDPFHIGIALREGKEGHNDLVFKIDYKGSDPLKEGSAASFEVSVLTVDSLENAQLIENKDPKAASIDIVLGDSQTVALTDAVVAKLFPGQYGGREHSFHSARNHVDGGGAMPLFVVDQALDQEAKAMPPRKPGEPYWIERPITPPEPKPGDVPPSKASAEAPKSVSGIWSVDVRLGGFYDKFRLTVQPTSGSAALFGMAAMQDASVNGGAGAALTGTQAFAPALLEAQGDTIKLSLHGGADADLTIQDSITVPKADIGVSAGGTGTSGDARLDRDHHIKVSGPEIGGDTTFEFQVRGGVNVGSGTKTASDLDVRAMANAAAVSAIPDQLKLGSVDEEAQRYDDALFAKRKFAYEQKAISDPVFKSYGVVYVTLTQLKAQVAKGKVDDKQQGVAADFAIKFTDAVNDETKSSPAYGAGEGKALADAIRKGDWANVWTLWRGVTYKFDAFILDQMKDKLGSNFFGTKQFESLLGAKKRVDDLRGKQDVVHLAALYFPDPKYRSQRNMLTTIPLSIYYFREDKKWKLKDYTDPDKEPVKHEVDDNGKAEPPEELFTQLDHLAEYPKGIIRWQIPGGSSGSFPTTDKQTTGEVVAAWLGKIALAAGAVGLALTGIGAVAEVALASTLGTVLLAASAVAGAGAAGVDLYEKSRQDTLTAMDAAVDVAQIAASLASLGTMPHGYFVSKLAQGVAVSGRAVALASKVYIPLRGINLAADVVTVMAVSKQSIDELDKIKGLPTDQQKQAWIVTVAQLFVTAGMTIVSIKGASADILKETPQIILRVDEHGVPIAELETGARAARVSTAGVDPAKPGVEAPPEGATEAAGTRGSYGPMPASGPRPTYIEVTGKGESSPGNLASRVRANFINTQRPLAHDAQLKLPPPPAPAAAGPAPQAPAVAGATPQAPTAAAAKAPPQTDYLLVIPASGNRAEMKITVKIESTNTRPQSVHGADTGPAAMEVRTTTDANGVVSYDATIQVHRDLAGADVGNAVGHELDELALIAVGGVKGADITAQQHGSLLQPIAAPAAGATAPTATAHDTASAREFAQAMPSRGGRPTGFEVPPEVMSRAKEMGFENEAFLDEKLALLKSVGVDEDMLKRLRVMAVQRGTISPKLPAGSTLNTPDLIGHMLYRTGGSAKSPIGGCHLDGALTTLQGELVANGEPIHLVRTADSPRNVGGATYNAYEQWKWKGGGTPGPRPTAPAGVHPFPPSPPAKGVGYWELAADPKTTFNDLAGFMTEADAAFAAWTTANPPVPGSTNVPWNAEAGPGRQKIAGWYDVDAKGKVTHRSVYPFRVGGVSSW